MKESTQVINEINSFIFKSLVDLLFTMVPKYKRYYELESDNVDYSVGVYLFMNDFASFLADEIKRNSSSEVVNSSFAFINEVGESHNLEIINIIKVGVLEILYTTEGVERQIVSKLLSQKQNRYFLNFQNFYR